MPHKHTRRKGGDESNFNLAPSTTANPLPTYTNPSKAKQDLKKNDPKKLKQKRYQSNNGYKHDDTPRAFTRLMHLQSSPSKKRPRSDLDDGNNATRPAKAKKRNLDSTAKEGVETTQPAASTTLQQKDLPTILPGERLVDFAARVDQALPVGGLKTKGRVKIGGVVLKNERQTKKEKKMQKMYDRWREEDARIKEKLAEQKEREQEEEDAENAEIDGQSVAFPDSRRSRKKRKNGGGKVEDDDEDPWAVLKGRREVRRGLHDVVQAPPNFKVKPRELFKVRNGARVEVENVPSAAGSLSRREELGRERRGVIDGYRGLMGKSG